jgi:putative transferase (TIGR04331 family)
VKNFLITESIVKQEIQDSYNLLFCGQRLRETIKEYNKKKNFVVIKNIYTDKNFYDYCLKYEKYFYKVLDILVESLNHYHNTNYDKKYWKILVAPWLFNFLTVIYDKWINFTKIRDTYKVDKIFADKDNKDLYLKNIAINSSDFLFQDTDTSWKIFIDEIIASNVFNNIDFLRVELKKNKKKENKKVKTKSNFYFGLKNKYFFLYHDFNVILKNLLNVIFFQFPNNGNLELVNKNNYSFNLRKNFKILDKSLVKDEFLNFFLKEIKFHIPCSLIENYKENKDLVQNSTWPSKPKIITSSRGMWFKDKFSFYYAEKYRLHSSKLHYFQHGAEYGSSKFFLKEKIEIQICDKFYSWGWKKENKTIPFGILKKNILIKKPKINKNLMLVTRLEKHTFKFHHGHFYDRSWINYHASNLKIIRYLIKKNYKDNIVVRFKKLDDTINEINTYNKFKNVIIDKGGENIEIYKKKYFFIFTYNSSLFLEYLSQNIPCMCLIDDSYKFNELGEYHYLILKKLDIVCESSEELVQKYLFNTKNFDKWWNNKENFDLRQNFCKTFAKTQNKKLLEIKKNFR